MPYSLRELEMTRIGDGFFSRRNTVFKSLLGKETVVVKVFPEGVTDAARKEYSMLQECQSVGVSAPIPLELADQFIVMEYVEGSTLSEHLDSIWLGSTDGQLADRIALDSAASSLGRWFSDFHSSFGNRLCRGDANMRNFLIDRRGVTGIDFEESGEGDIINDIGQACSSILSMRPMFTRDKAKFCRTLAEKYFTAMGFTKTTELGESTAHALEHYASYRSDGESMVKKAAEIRSMGIWSDEE